MMPAFGNVAAFHWGGILFGLLAWSLAIAFVVGVLTRLSLGTRSPEDSTARPK